MRQLTFFDLPIEIIDYIIECLPYYIVLELQNFSVSRPYVLQILYKKVEINSFSPPLIQSTIKFPDRNDLVIKHIPTRMTFDELDLAIKMIINYLGLVKFHSIVPRHCFVPMNYILHY